METATSPFAFWNATSTNTTSVCMGAEQVFTALFLVLLILFTVVGNILIVLSICIYRRMRTFTNVLLLSLATVDLLVGVAVMPPAMLYLLQQGWSLGVLPCKLWSTVDVLLCTASILNLCVISLDRYFAINWPLKYIRRRTKTFAAVLLVSVYVVSLIICSPPWFIPTWGFETKLDPATGLYQCSYVQTLSYRIYSACGSFYLPLIVMLFVYYKIFQVANHRERALNMDRTGSRMVKMIRGGGGGTPAIRHTSGGNRSGATTPISAVVALGRQESNGKRKSDDFPLEARHVIRHNRVLSDASTSSDFQREQRRKFLFRGDTTGSLASQSACNSSLRTHGCSKFDTLGERSSNSHEELAEDTMTNALERNSASRLDSVDIEVDAPSTPGLVQTARQHYVNNCKKEQNNYYGPQPVQMKPVPRPSREKLLYLKERKALKTIGIVVSGFIICWLPFFVLYLLQSAVESLRVPPHLEWVFLWLGYSNSVLNPIIYTFYNQEFRRCFKDLLMWGCFKREMNRRMSVRILHQTRT